MTCIVCMNPIAKTFYTSVDHRGVVDTYCFECYQKTIVDNYPNMVTNPLEVLQKCECGTKAKVGQGHSSWCDLFRKEFS